MGQRVKRVTIHLPYDKGGLLDRLYQEAKVERVDYGETIDVVAVCTPRTIGQLGPLVEGWQPHWGALGKVRELEVRNSRWAVFGVGWDPRRKAAPVSKGRRYDHIDHAPGCCSGPSGRGTRRSCGDSCRTPGWGPSQGGRPTTSVENSRRSSDGIFGSPTCSRWQTGRAAG